MPKGGAREGAGRRILGGGDEKRATFSFSLRPSLVSALEAFAAGQSLSKSQALEAIIEAHLSIPQGETEKAKAARQADPGA